jgi:hypothetical protein
MNPHAPDPWQGQLDMNGEAVPPLWRVFPQTADSLAHAKTATAYPNGYPKPQGRQLFAGLCCCFTNACGSLLCPSLEPQATLHRKSVALQKNGTRHSTRTFPTPTRWIKPCKNGCRSICARSIK